MALNWKEIQAIRDELAQRLEGAAIQKVTLAGTIGAGEVLLLQVYQKGEGNRRLLISVRGAKPFLGLLPKGVSVAAAQKADTFIMVMRKHLGGRRLRAVHQTEGDRVIRFEFNGGQCLVCELIPNRANIVLLENWQEESCQGKYLTSLKRVSLEKGGLYALTAPGSVSEVKAPDRDLESGMTFSETIVSQFLSELQSDGLQQHRQKWLQVLRGQMKKLNTAIRNAKKNLAHASSRDKIRQMALALNSNLYELGPKNLPQAEKIELPDPSTGELLEVQLRKEKTFAENSELLFQKAKKLDRTEEEEEKQIAQLQKKVEKLNRLEQLLEATTTIDELQGMREAFQKVGLKPPAIQASKKKPQTDTRKKPYLELLSSDGFTIFCGRNKEENRTVTFKVAKGNDTWMHLKGVPGAHVVIRSMKQKTVPLQTLLEGAQLVLYYSRIRGNRKADVDYTMRKYVRSIKGTLSEVTYSENKTLHVEPDQELLKNLLQNQQ